MELNQVSRCVCHDRSFEEIKSFACDQNIISTEQLQERNFCSTQCKICRPYVKKMLQTGQTSFTAGEIDTQKQAS